MAFIAITWQIFWHKFYRNIPWVDLFQTYHLQVQSLNLIGCHRKTIKKSTPQKLKGEANAETLKIVYSISLYKFMFLLPLLKYFGCYGNLKFPLTYNGKSEIWHLLLSHCIYDKSFTELFLVLSCNKHFNLWKPFNLIGCHGSQKAKFAKTNYKINCWKDKWGIMLKLCRNILSISLYKKTKIL